MTTELQRLTGENKVLRDLLAKTVIMTEHLLEQDDMPAYEARLLTVFLDQINAAIGNTPADLLETA